MTKPTATAALEAELAGQLGHAIKRAEQAINAEKAAVLRTFGLTVPQFTVLYAVSRIPGSSGAQLARICEVTPQTMTTVLTNLESKGLIERTQSSVHQKVLITTLTPAGRTLLRKAALQERTIEDRLQAAFTDDEITTLLTLLTRAIRSLTPTD